MAVKANLEFNGISGLTQAQRDLLLELWAWDYNKGKASSYNLAQKLGYSISTMTLAIRILRDRGILAKSRGGSWFIRPEVRKVLERGGKKDEKN